MNKRITAIIMATLFLLLCMVGCSRPQSKQEIVDYVAQNVPEAATLIDSKVNNTSTGTEYLNGVDDEEEIYKILESMLISRK